MSLVVALDTSAEHVALGLAEVDPFTGTALILAEETLRMPRMANAVALPALRELFAAGGIAPELVSAVVVGRGPGSFTGVRIGLATAKGLAHGRGVPLVAVPTLDAIAWGCVARDGLLGVVGDAMRGEVYPARYRVDGTGLDRLDREFGVAAPADAAARWASEGASTIALAGNGLAKYADVFADALGDRALVLPEALWRPSAAGLFAAARELLVEAFADPLSADPALALPIYTRLSDAEEAEAARRGRPAGSVPGSGVAGPGEDAGDPAASPEGEGS